MNLPIVCQSEDSHTADAMPLAIEAVLVDVIIRLAPVKLRDYPDGRF